MQKTSRISLFLCLAVCLFSVCYAAEDNYGFDDPAQRQAFLRLTADLRCPMCQNQNIADSDAMIARDMRRKVYQLMQQGKSEQQIIDFMKQRYGDFVYYQPPVTPATSLLWIIPIAFVLFGGFAFIGVRLRTKSNNSTSASEANNQALAKANDLLKQEK